MKTKWLVGIAGMMLLLGMLVSCSSVHKDTSITVKDATGTVSKVNIGGKAVTTLQANVIVTPGEYDVSTEITTTETVMIGASSTTVTRTIPVSKTIEVKYGETKVLTIKKTSTLSGTIE